MDLLQILLGLSLTAILIITFAFARSSKRAKIEREKQATIIRQLQENQQQHQLELVESTLNPHLFKNVLNSIQSHAYQTYYALDKLATVLDYILYDSRQPFVSVKEEVEFAISLIEINKIKLSPLFELQVKSKIDKGDEYYLQKVMAPMLTIDLIENAFKHADIQSADAFIKIVMEMDNGTFSLTVSNKISERPPITKQKSGIGSKTLDQRLQLIYGKHYTLERNTTVDQYIAKLKVNLRDYKNEMHSAG